MPKLWGCLFLLILLQDSSVLDVSFSGGSARIGRKLLGSASGAVVAASLAASGRVLLDTASLPPLPALPPLTPLPQPSPLPALAPTPVNIDFPGGSVDVNRSGVDVQFPGGEVNIGRKLLRAGEEVPQTGVASRDHQEGTLLIEMQTAGSEGLKIAKVGPNFAFLPCCQLLPALWNAKSDLESPSSQFVVQRSSSNPGSGSKLCWLSKYKKQTSTRTRYWFHA